MTMNRPLRLSLAATPAIGWNSWNTFGHRIKESVVRETADALSSSGLKEYGYEYIVIDDCWSIKDRRDGNGDLIADPKKFPNGIKARDIGLLDAPKLAHNLWTQYDIADFKVELRL